MHTHTHTLAGCADDTSGPTFCGSCSCAITISLGLSLEDVGFRINGQSVVSLINSDPVVWGVFVGKCQSSYISAWVDSGVGSIQVAEKLARQCKKSADQLLACKEQVDASPEFKQLLESGDAGP